MVLNEIKTSLQTIREPRLMEVRKAWAVLPQGKTVDKDQIQRDELQARCSCFGGGRGLFCFVVLEKGCLGHELTTEGLSLTLIICLPWLTEATLGSWGSLGRLEEVACWAWLQRVDSEQFDFSHQCLNLSPLFLYFSFLFRFFFFFLFCTKMGLGPREGQQYLDRELRASKTGSSTLSELHVRQRLYLERTKEVRNRNVPCQ